jgi:hypothetical protein
LSFGVHCGAAGLADRLALGLHGLTQFESLAVGCGFGGLARGLQVVALDNGDQLAGFDVLALVDK